MQHRQQSQIATTTSPRLQLQEVQLPVTKVLAGSLSEQMHRERLEHTTNIATLRSALQDCGAQPKLATGAIEKQPCTEPGHCGSEDGDTPTDDANLNLPPPGPLTIWEGPAGSLIPISTWNETDLMVNLNPALDFAVWRNDIGQHIENLRQMVYLLGRQNVQDHESVATLSRQARGGLEQIHNYLQHMHAQIVAGTLQDQRLSGLVNGFQVGLAEFHDELGRQANIFNQMGPALEHLSGRIASIEQGLVQIPVAPPQGQVLAAFQSVEERCSRLQVELEVVRSKMASPENTTCVNPNDLHTIRAELQAELYNLASRLANDIFSQRVHEIAPRSQDLANRIANLELGAAKQHAFEESTMAFINDFQKNQTSLCDQVAQLEQQIFSTGQEASKLQTWAVQELQRLEHQLVAETQRNNKQEQRLEQILHSLQERLDYLEGDFYWTTPTTTHEDRAQTPSPSGKAQSSSPSVHFPYPSPTQPADGEPSTAPSPPKIVLQPPPPSQTATPYPADTQEIAPPPPLPTPSSAEMGGGARYGRVPMLLWTKPRP